jgi:hypothetical protein
MDENKIDLERLREVMDLDALHVQEVSEVFSMPTIRLHQRFLDLGYEELNPVETSRRNTLEDLHEKIGMYEIQRGTPLDRPIIIPAEFVPESQAAKQGCSEKVVYAVYSFKGPQE